LRSVKCLSLREVGNIRPMKVDLAGLQKCAGRYTGAWCGYDANSVASFYSPEVILS